ncbi:hypothetical protein PHYBOEH_001190 [Phytophthora boehmeriae]|uniref:PDZ domain-containing protein n=1 Tax=Phytophthora boehmeriae TaxID=109152 RepID=A0A8T1WVK8_9STRA|nr:hypothetical protein PHYBOEH_001190 [Phytophthora boehmeriae]
MGKYRKHSKDDQAQDDVAHEKRSRNSSKDHQETPTPFAVHEANPVLSPVSKSTHLSPTEPWDLPENVSSPTSEVEQVDVDVGIDVSVSTSTDTNLVAVPVAGEADLVEEAELAEEVELADEGELVEEAELAGEAELALPVDASADSGAKLDVEIGMLADVEVGVAVEDAETVSDVVESSSHASESPEETDPWDMEPDFESEHQKTDHQEAALLHDEELSSKIKDTAIDSTVGSPQVNFADAAEPADEFSNEADISGDIDNAENEIMIDEAAKDKVGSASLPKASKPSLTANLSKYKKKGKTARGVKKLPALTELEALTVPLVAPNAVNTTVQVRGRPRPKLTMADTPDSTTYLVKWKENRSLGLQLKEVRFAKGTYPLVTDVCQEPCCELLRHICIGDVIIEINGRNTSTMGVKKTVNFLKTCSKTTLLKIRHGPAYLSQRVSASV